MKATGQLKEEHKGVLAMLGSFETILDRMVGGGAPDRAELASILDFLRVFVDKCHHGKEEELLFPALMRQGVGYEGGPVGMMLQEHEAGRALVKTMAAILGRDTAAGFRGSAALATDSGDWADFVESGRAYIALLRAHIVKEESVLFSVADDLLDAESQAAMYGKFEEIEEKRIGAGRHEAFHALIESLAAKYALA